MPIVHIVLFEFKPTTTHSQVEDVSVFDTAQGSSIDGTIQVCRGMLALKDNCIHPQTNKAYVKSYGGGRDTSPEGQQVGGQPVEA